MTPCSYMAFVIMIMIMIMTAPVLTILQAGGLLLCKWDEAATQLEIAEAAYHYERRQLWSSRSCSFLSISQEVDLMLYKWDQAAKQLEIAEAAYEASDLTTRPTQLIGGCCCFGRTKVLAAVTGVLE